MNIIHRTPSAKTLVCKLIFALVFFLYAGTVLAERLSPAEIVKLWIQVYPKDMKSAAAITTQAFRKGQTPADWIASKEETLKDLELHYLGGNIISEKLEGDVSVVHFNAHLSTVLGDHTQEEVYRLRKQVDGGWLIESIEVEDEHFHNPAM